MNNFNKHTDAVVEYDLYSTNTVIAFPKGQKACKYCSFLKRDNQFQWRCDCNEFNGVSSYVNPEAIGNPIGCPLEKIKNESGDNSER